jgi:hypothetical protein
VRIGELLGSTQLGTRHDLESSIAVEGSLGPDDRIVERDQ